MVDLLRYTESSNVFLAGAGNTRKLETERSKVLSNKNPERIKQ